jgi:hypothetical protein
LEANLAKAGISFAVGAIEVHGGPKGFSLSDRTRGVADDRRGAFA